MNDKESGYHVRSPETGKFMGIGFTRDDARRIAALLNASDGMTTEAIEALEDGGLARVVAERDELRSIARLAQRRLDAGSTSPEAWALVERALRAALDTSD